MARQPDGEEHFDTKDYPDWLIFILPLDDLAVLLLGGLQ